MSQTAISPLRLALWSAYSIGSNNILARSPAEASDLDEGDAVEGNVDESSSRQTSSVREKMLARKVASRRPRLPRPRRLIRRLLTGIARALFVLRAVQI